MPATPSSARRRTTSDILADKGPSDNDQRHRFVLSGTVSRALAGFQVGYVFSCATGVPFNPVTGTDRNNDSTNNDRPEGMGRNSARQPATSALDVRLSRAFFVAEAASRRNDGRGIQRPESRQRGQVNNTFGPGATPVATFGRPTAASDPRQIQLGVRWDF